MSKNTKEIPTNSYVVNADVERLKQFAMLKATTEEDKKEVQSLIDQLSPSPSIADHGTWWVTNAVIDEEAQTYTVMGSEVKNENPTMVIVTLNLNTGKKSQLFANALGGKLTTRQSRNIHINKLLTGVDSALINAVISNLARKAQRTIADKPIGETVDQVKRDLNHAINLI